MTKLIEKMLEEIEGAEDYCKAAKEADTQEAKRIYKDLALAELNHFDRLASLYTQKMSLHARNGHDSEELSDVWFKYFKGKTERLKMQINEI